MFQKMLQGGGGGGSITAFMIGSTQNTDAYTYGTIHHEAFADSEIGTLNQNENELTFSKAGKYRCVLFNCGLYGVSSSYSRLELNSTELATLLSGQYIYRVIEINANIGDVLKITYKTGSATYALGGGVFVTKLWF